MNLKSIGRFLVPKQIRVRLVSTCSACIESIAIFQAPFKHKRALKLVKRKKRIKVAFFLIHSSVWKYDLLYQLLCNDPRFEVVVIVCPYINLQEKAMLKEMENAYNWALERNYNVLKSYAQANTNWLDVKREISPDVIFFTNPHNLTRKQYYITSFTNTLTCYVPYNFGNGSGHFLEMMHNQAFHNVVWRLFAETTIHKSYSETHARNQGKNVVVTGFPGTDLLLDKNYIPSDKWKIKDKNFKRIIWAPHHTIETIDAPGVAPFLLYADLMLDLMLKFKGRLQIAFKPHPILKNKLYNLQGWGEKRTDQYYKQWELHEIGHLSESSYIDLFLTSDAMIHDSGSFLIEYLYTGKPVLHTNRDDKIIERLNRVGADAFKRHYHARSKEDIVKFISNVLNNQDIKANERLAYLDATLIPPNGLTASQNIFNELVHELFN